MVSEETNCIGTKKACETTGRKSNVQFTYGELSFLLLIFSTRTVTVMPMSTPAASNKATTLMTSPDAIWGRGFSTEEDTIKVQTNTKQGQK